MSARERGWAGAASPLEWVVAGVSALLVLGAATGTSAKTLDSVYDDVSVEEMRDALAALENPVRRRGG